jgi:hypothetical protein
MALTRNGETVSDSILGSDLSETAPVLGRAADTLERQAQEIQRLRDALEAVESEIMLDGQLAEIVQAALSSQENKDDR